MRKQGIQNMKAILKFSSSVPVFDNIESDINLIRKKCSVTCKHLRLRFVYVQLRQVNSIKAKSKIALLFGVKKKTMKGKQMSISATRKTATLPSLVPSPPCYINIALKRVELLATPFPTIVLQW